VPIILNFTLRIDEKEARVRVSSRPKIANGPITVLYLADHDAYTRVGNNNAIASENGGGDIVRLPLRCWCAHLNDRDAGVCEAQLHEPVHQHQIQESSLIRRRAIDVLGSVPDQSVWLCAKVKVNLNAMTVQIEPQHNAERGGTQFSLAGLYCQKHFHICAVVR